jgi:Cu2+-exporting ATPase
VYFDSLTMFVFFLLTGRWLELRLRDRTAGALEAAAQSPTRERGATWALTVHSTRVAVRRHRGR